MATYSRLHNAVCSNGFLRIEQATKHKRCGNFRRWSPHRGDQVNGGVAF
jgi:hypothetical protein